MLVLSASRMRLETPPTIQKHAVRFLKKGRYRPLFIKLKDLWVLVESVPGCKIRGR